MTQNIPSELWRHIFSLKLESNPLFIFNFTREMIILGEYKKNEFSEIIKNAIIRNFKKQKVPFFNFCLEKTDLENDKFSILKSKIFLSNINILNSIDDCYLFLGDINKIDIHTRDKNFLNYIFTNNNIELIKYLIFKNNINACYFAARNNNVKILRFIKKEIESCQYYEWNEIHSCHWACFNDNLEMLKILREGNKPSPWDKYCCNAACYNNNNLEMLMFLREGNDPCPWHEDCCYRACCNNNLEMLMFLREGNDPCPWDKEKCIMSCDRKKYPKILEWINFQK